MAFLVRKINVENWPDGVIRLNTNIDDLPADSITSDLKTTNNDLSFWKIENLTEVDKVGMAIISSFDKTPRTLFLVALSYEDIASNFTIKNTPRHGKTAIIEMKQFHYDVRNLNYKLLGELSNLIASATANPQHLYVIPIDITAVTNQIKALVGTPAVDSNALGEYIKNQL